MTIAMYGVSQYNQIPINEGRSKSSTLTNPKVFGKKAKFKNPTVNKWLAGLYSGICPPAINLL